MRFAWIRKKDNRDTPPKKVFTHPLNLLMMAYNIIWWIPIILPFTGVISYYAGFISFLVVTVVRLIANLIRNNVLDMGKAEVFPLRSP
jgi:hypothetical protein